VKMPKERISLRLHLGLARWLRREAAARHTTVSAVIEDCVRREKDMERAEIFARAALKGVCLVLARGDKERAKELERELAAEALAEVKGARGGG